MSQVIIHCRALFEKTCLVFATFTIVSLLLYTQYWGRGKEIDTQTLTRYGYKSMQQLRNWRWYKGLGGGPIVDLGSHQIDIYNWFLNAYPQSVMASGRTNYYDKRTHEWYDTVMAVYEYQAAQGSVTAFYQTISTNSANGYFETFMGNQGTLVISEASHRGEAYREPRTNSNAWAKWVNIGYLKAPKEIKEIVNLKFDLTLPMYVNETPPPMNMKRL